MNEQSKTADCDQITANLIAYIKGELDDKTKQRVEEHLAYCPHCRHELQEAQRVLEWTEAASEAPVIRLVNNIIISALKSNASDIHFEPQHDNTIRVRYRVDGVLQDVETIDASMQTAVIAKVKLMAEMNMAEHNLPQDGRIGVRHAGKDYNLRVSCIPFLYGEGFVCRILDKSNVLLELDKLGFHESQLQSLEEIIRQPNGFFIMSGPTGSGKTTTAYSILQRIVSPDMKALTVEDPVEVALPGVNQTQVNKKAGFTFVSALRAFTRHDPDVVLVGEIRDLETAQTCTQLALTGHLVMSMLHTDDAVNVIQRLQDMQMEPYVVSATLIGVVAQRLAREVCESCKTEVELDPANPKVRALGITAEELKQHKIYQGTGCEVCRNTGYRGRTAIFEILKINKQLSTMIADGATTVEIKKEAQAHGFVTMREAGKQKVLDGVTTLDEVFRILI